jgi:hypothetical protein
MNIVPAEASRMLTFFPWVTLRSRVDVGPFGLEPWDAEAPGEEWVKRVLAPYRGHPNRPVSKATVVSRRGTVGEQWDDKVVEEFFRLRELISFVALTRRRFFQHSGYINDVSLRAVVQRVDWKQGGGVTRHSRRRDGRRIVYSVEGVYRVDAPEQVEAEATLDLDGDLVNALWKVLSKGDACSTWLENAITLFNLANTDDDTVREHTEIVLMVSSAQALPRLHEFEEGKVATAFAKVLDEVLGPTKEVASLPKSRDTGSVRKGMGLRELWFRDLYRTRGSIAHGALSPGENRRWSLREHLLLASHIIPLTVLAELSKAGCYTLTDGDRDGIHAFDGLLCMEDCFAQEEHTMSWRWPKVLLGEEREAAIGRVLVELGSLSDS